MLTVIFIQSDAKDSLSTHRTLDLTSSLEVGPATNHAAGDVPSCHYSRSVLTIAFQFPFDSSLQDNVATMARQYVRSVISSVQRVAMAISPTGLSPAMGPKLSPGSPEALTLAHWICQSYRWVLLWFLIMWLGCVTLWLALQNPLNTKKWMLNFFLSSWSTIFCWADIKCFNIGPSNIFLCKLVNYILYFFPSYHIGADLLRSDSLGGDSVLKHLWNHQDAILCCSLKVQIPVENTPFFYTLMEQLWSLYSGLAYCSIVVV